MPGPMATADRCPLPKMKPASINGEDGLSIRATRSLHATTAISRLACAFFFSSRRRHTRCGRDWSSDVCSSDLGLALDVGAGSGRDALALAERGWDVVAVEPAAELRRLGEAATVHRSIQWVDDSLPDLSEIRKLSYRFDLVLVSAVWMHLPPTYRERAFRILTELLAPSGMLVITLRHGPGDGERQFYEVSKAELDSFARHRAVMPVPLPDMPRADQLKREDVWWETAVYRLPDDGTGALPTLRHIIINDNKSSTYKLGLLRTLVRMADSAPGLVLNRSDDWVELPLGAVGLFWIMLYHPLVLKHHLRRSEEHTSELQSRPH